jgi:hypothetical protein
MPVASKEGPMPQAKGQGKGKENIKYGAKITIEITGKIRNKDLEDLLTSLGGTLKADLENGP